MGSRCTRDILNVALTGNNVRLVHSSAARHVGGFAMSSKDNALRSLSTTRYFAPLPSMRLLHTQMPRYSKSQLKSSGVFMTDVNSMLVTRTPNDVFNTKTGYAQICCNSSSTYRNFRSFWRKAIKAPKPPPPPPKFNYKFDFDHTLKSIQGIHQYVKENLSLDLWTVNLLLVGFVAGPSIYTAMKNSSHTEDDYMFSIPVDDPVEHSVRILMELTEESASPTDEESLLKSTFNNPEDDAKRILNDLLASEHLRTTASRIASGVIQSPPFQNACKALVRNIWNDLMNDPETNNQLVSLVQSVLQNERVYAAVKDMMLKLVNDEEVYKELTKLVVQLGEEEEVLDATQRLLTESTHKTLNDPSVLDHSMEFATEVVGDDIVQRSGGEALRNTLGYAVQPSSGAVFAGLGTMLVAGLLHFYFFRGKGNYIEEGWLSPRPSFDSLNSSDARNRSFDSSVGGGNMPSIFQNACAVITNIACFPVLLVGSICNGVKRLCSYPRQAFSYGSQTIHSCANCISTIPNNVWSKMTTFPTWFAALATSCASSVSKFASTKIVDVKSVVANFGMSLMDSIHHASKTTKGATCHIISVLQCSIKHSVDSVTQLLTSLGNRFTSSSSEGSSHATS